MMEFLKNFIELTRAYTLPITFASCFIIYSYAHYSSEFYFPAFILLIFALCCIHLYTNLYDDYKDIKKQIQKGNKLEDISFTGYIPKAVLILNKTFSIKQVRYILGLTSMLGLGIGITFALDAGWPVLFFIIAGIVLILLYPESSKIYCQELTVGLIFGPLVIMGGYYALTKEFNSSLLLLSFAIFFATLTLLHAKNIMDWEFDINAGKKTLAILSGSKENAIKWLSAIAVIPYVIVVIGVLFNQIFNPSMLCVFLTLPIYCKLISSMKEYIEVKDVEFNPRWYWGFFENWKTIKEKRIDFFMFRFYLARNFAFFFALFAALGVIGVIK